MPAHPAVALDTPLLSTDPYEAAERARQAMAEALDILDHAAADWHDGSLHWPVAVSLARRRLREALEALG